jgi:hypothetical protein
LRSLRCKEMQGYFFSRPLAPENATELLGNSESIRLKTTGKVGVSKICFGLIADCTRMRYTKGYGQNFLTTDEHR